MLKINIFKRKKIKQYELMGKEDNRNPQQRKLFYPELILSLVPVHKPLLGHFKFSQTLPVLLI